MKNNSLNKLDFELLHIFDIVSNFSSFNQASNYLYLDQSTVSKKIRQLETICNQKLFIRNSNGISLNNKGIIFKSKVEKILKELDNLLDYQVDTKILRLGVFDNVSAYLMPDFFTHNFNKFKELKISSKSIELINLFNEGKLDAVIVNSSFFSQIQGNFIETNIAQEPFAVLFNKKLIPFKDQKIFTLADLKSRNIILAPNYCPVNNELHDSIDYFKDYIELDYVDSMINFVKNSNYLTILPLSMAHALALQDDNLSYQKISDFAKRQISLFTREEKIDQLLSRLIKNA